MSGPRGRRVHSSEPMPLPLTAADEPEAAELALALLGQRTPGIRRLCFVGLAERAGVHLVVAAREQGLESKVSRGASGRLTVVLEAPPAPVAWSRPRSTLAARCRRLLQRLTRHE